MNRLLTFVTVILFSVLLSGCFLHTKKPQYLIPEWDTAKQQYQQAERQQRAADQTFNKKDKRDEIGKAILAYQMVADRFPDDEEFTPVASLRVADLHHELKDDRSAEKQYDFCLKRYPKFDDIRAGAAFGMGRSLDALNRTEEAQKYYKLVLDEFQDDPRFKEIVAGAQARYTRIRKKG